MMQENKRVARMGAAHTGEARHRRRQRRGTTLVEMMMVLACFSIVVLGAVQIMRQTSLSTLQLNAWNSLTIWGEKAVDKIALDLTQARLIYQNDALGIDYFDSLTGSDYSPLTGTQLSVINPAGTFDAALTYTGNALLFIKESLPITADAGGTVYRIDIYRMVHYYLSPVAQEISGESESLRLVRWESITYADYAQVIAIDDAAGERTNVVIALHTDGITHLWSPRDAPATAFYPIDEFGNIGATDPNYLVEMDTAQPVINDLGLGYASVAWNRSSAFWTPDPVPKFAVESGEFPGGLEIQIIGPTGARQILTRLVLAYFISAEQGLYSNENITITTMREF